MGGDRSVLMNEDIKQAFQNESRKEFGVQVPVTWNGTIAPACFSEGEVQRDDFNDFNSFQLSFSYPTTLQLDSDGCIYNFNMLESRWVSKTICVEEYANVTNFFSIFKRSKKEARLSSIPVRLFMSVEQCSHRFKFHQLCTTSLYRLPYCFSFFISSIRSLNQSLSQVWILSKTSCSQHSWKFLLHHIHNPSFFFTSLSSYRSSLNISDDEQVNHSRKLFAYIIPPRTSNFIPIPDIIREVQHFRCLRDWHASQMHANLHLVTDKRKDIGYIIRGRREQRGRRWHFNYRMNEQVLFFELQGRWASCFFLGQWNMMGEEV